MTALPVIFRAERSGPFKGDVTAVFPTLPGTNNRHSFTVYATVGQHAWAYRSWYNETRAATPAEYAEILRELRQVYDDHELVVCQRLTRRHDAARRTMLEAAQ